MKKILFFAFLTLLGFQISCNKNNQEESNEHETSLASDSLSYNYEETTSDNEYSNRANNTYGFAVFRVHNDLNQRLNDISRHSRPRPVEYNVVTKITTFNGYATEEAKYRVLDDEQSNLNRNLQVLDRDFLLFNSYEEASRARANY